MKTTTVWFAALPALLCRSRRGVIGAAFAVIPLGLLHLGSFVGSPSAYGAFLSGAMRLDDRGKINPSALALFRDGADVAGLPGYADRTPGTAGLPRRRAKCYWRLCALMYSRANVL